MSVTRKLIAADDIGPELDRLKEIKDRSLVPGNDQEHKDAWVQGGTQVWYIVLKVLKTLNVRMDDSRIGAGILQDATRRAAMGSLYELDLWINLLTTAVDEKAADYVTKEDIALLDSLEAIPASILATLGAKEEELRERASKNPKIHTALGRPSLEAYLGGQAWAHDLITLKGLCTEAEAVYGVKPSWTEENAFAAIAASPLFTVSHALIEGTFRAVNKAELVGLFEKIEYPHAIAIKLSPGAATLVRKLRLGLPLGRRIRET